MSRFEGREAFESAVVQTLQWAAERCCLSLQAWDPNFVDWPWSEAQVLDALTAWAKPGRSLQLLAADYEVLSRRHPRFVRWRRDFGHVVTARAVDAELRPESGPEALLVATAASGSRCLSLFDRRQWRGVVSHEATDRQRALDWFDALAQRSGESFAPTTLGL